MALTADAAYGDALAGLLADTESPGRRQLLSLMGEALEEAGRRGTPRDVPSDEELLSRHTVDQQRRGGFPNSIRAREKALRLVMKWLEPRSILSATKDDIEAYLDSRPGSRGTGLAVASRRAYLTHIRCFFYWCIEEEFLLSNPTVRIRSPKRPAALPRPLTPADLAHALDPAHFGRTYVHRRLRTFVLLGAFAGLRCQEMAGLCVEDVDTVGRELKVRSGKGGKQRNLPLRDEVLKALTALPLPESGPVFFVEQPRCNDGAPGRFPVNGQPIKPHNISHLVSNYLRGIGIDANCHALRHTFASKIYQATQDLRLTQELLGHSSVATTQVYAACDTTKKAPAVMALRVGE